MNVRPDSSTDGQPFDDELHRQPKENTPMSIEPATSHDPAARWEARLTKREARGIGIESLEYDEGTILARQTAAEHRTAGTPRHLWEPTCNQNAMFAEPYIAEGEGVLTQGLETEVDPVLESSQAVLDEVEGTIRQLAEGVQPIIATERRGSYGRHEAVAKVDEHEHKMAVDEQSGFHHHRRANPVLKFTGKASPWAEAVGFLAFVTYFLNVPLLAPWLDLLGWTLAFTIVIFIILGQTWLVHHAAIEHNRGRECHADDHRHQGEAAFGKRNRYLAVAGFAALGITAGMIWRGLAALGDVSLGTTVVMVFLAAVTGILMPVLAFLGTALDGSSVSREHDQLVASLDADLDDHQATIEALNQDLIEVAGDQKTLNGMVFMDLCERVQQEVDRVYRQYGIVRNLIGGLAANPPQPIRQQIRLDERGQLQGAIVTSLPGARAVDLAPLLNRVGRLGQQDQRRAALEATLKALPAHPWARR